MPDLEGGAVSRELWGAWKQLPGLQSFGAGFGGTLKGGAIGGVAGLTVGGVGGAGIGAAVGGLVGGFTALTKASVAIVPLWEKLTLSAKTLTEHFGKFSGLLSKFSSQWKMLEFQITRTWAAKVAPILAKWNEYAMEFTKRWTAIKIRFFEAIEPILSFLLDLLNTVLKPTLRLLAALAEVLHFIMRLPGVQLLLKVIATLGVLIAIILGPIGVVAAIGVLIIAFKVLVWAANAAAIALGRVAIAGGAGVGSAIAGGAATGTGVSLGIWGLLKAAGSGLGGIIKAIGIGIGHGIAMVFKAAIAAITGTIGSIVVIAVGTLAYISMIWRWIDAKSEPFNRFLNWVAGEPKPAAGPAKGIRPEIESFAGFVAHGQGATTRTGVFNISVNVGSTDEMRGALEDVWGEIRSGLRILEAGQILDAYRYRAEGSI